MCDKRPELILIRHAPVAMPAGKSTGVGGPVLAGRSDFPARIDDAAVARVRGALPAVSDVVSSPALRCRTTAQALFPGQPFTQDTRLWEQDFGSMDGAPLSDLPDLGDLTGAELAAHRWPGGESFSDVCARIEPALIAAAARAEQTGPVAVVAHAGVIRAALALVTGHIPGALAFEIAPLSVTRLGVWRGRPVSVRCVNRGGT